MKPPPTILIVDDDADDREIIRDAFLTAQPDACCVFLDNGEQCLNYLEAAADGNFPALVMLDLNMPGKDGKEVVKRMKSDERLAHLPVIVFTTSSSLRDKQSVYGLGANCFVTKPDTFNKLIELTTAIGRLWLA